MKYLSKEQVQKLPRDELYNYVVDCCKESIETSIRKQRNSENYSLAAWPYMQADENGAQRALLKLLKQLKHD